ncbi:MAG: phosphotransferase [Candidatus Dormibacteria bacterium]|jgi:hypothetical protein
MAPPADGETSDAPAWAGGLDGYMARTLRRLGAGTLPAHLEREYGIQVSGVTELDVGVVRVDRQDGPSWVARVFPADRPLEAVEGDARILSALQRQGFPAERCASPHPVSVHEGQGVLVTEWVAGERAEGRGHTFGVLGALLGALHARSATVAVPMRRGGAWHHLCPADGPRDEIAAAVALLDAARDRLPGEHAPLVAALRDELLRSDDCEDLPQALLHPDFVPVNAVQTAEGRLVMVDWTGAGRGPRLWSLAFLLWAAGVRDLRLVDAAVSHYRRHLLPEAGELERLASAMLTRPLVLDCWAVCVGRRSLPDVVRDLPAREHLTQAIAARARQGFAGSPAGDGVSPPAPPRREGASPAST